MKKGQYYFEHLSEQEQKEFTENLEKEKRNLKSYLNGNYNSFGGFLLQAFFWIDSKQGFQYWDKISLRKID